MSRRLERELQDAVDRATDAELAAARTHGPLTDAERLLLHQLRLVEWIDNHPRTGPPPTVTRAPAPLADDEPDVRQVERVCRRGHTLPPGVFVCATCHPPTQPPIDTSPPNARSVRRSPTRGTRKPRTR